MSKRVNHCTGANPGKPGCRCVFCTHKRRKKEAKILTLRQSLASAILTLRQSLASAKRAAKMVDYAMSTTVDAELLKNNEQECRVLHNAIQNSQYGDALQSLSEHVLRCFCETGGYPDTAAIKAAIASWPGTALKGAPVVGLKMPTYSELLRDEAKLAQTFAPAGAESGTAGGDGGTMKSGEDEVLTLEDAEKRIILRTLAVTGGNISDSAKRLGIHRSTLHRKMARYGLATEEQLAAAEENE